MSDLIPFSSMTSNAISNAIVPRVDGLSIRPAHQDDFAWIDALQKSESNKIAFLPEKAIRNRIKQGNLLVAEQAPGRQAPGRNVAEGLDHVPVGYCMAVDRYMHQDHVGQFIQLNIAPGSRRSLVGAALVQATFEKSAYGVKLFGLWCRQDLKANDFWASLGFVPIAFRTAGQSTLDQLKRQAKKAGRDGTEGDLFGGVHIYWQRPIRGADYAKLREGNFRGWWIPFETRGGLMGKSRVVLPIPPEVDWRDLRPIDFTKLPGAEARAAATKQIAAEVAEQTADAAAAVKAKQQEARAAKKAARDAAAAGKVVKGMAAPKAVGGVGFGLPPDVQAQRDAERKAEAAAAEKQRLKAARAAVKKAAKAARKTSDPELLRYVREMRDRWLEAVAEEPGLLGPPAGAAWRHDVSRSLEAGSAGEGLRLGEGAGPMGRTEDGVRRLAA